MKEYMIWVFSQRQFHVILHAICCCAWKMLHKILQSLLTFSDISQPFKRFSILSPNITIDFLLFELMSQLLIDELFSLLPAFSLESVINSVSVDTALEVLLCDAELFCFDSWFNKESITLSFLFICSFRKAMFSSNKMINLSGIFDLLTLSVVYDVSNCFLKTFTSARNYSLNVRKSSKKLSSDLLESLTLLVTSFLFIISRWYSLSFLLPVPTIRLLSLFSWDSFGSDKQVLRSLNRVSTKKFQPSASTRRAQLSVAVTTVRSTDHLNCNVKTCVNAD